MYQSSLLLPTRLRASVSSPTLEDRLAAERELGTNLKLASYKLYKIMSRPSSTVEGIRAFIL